MAGPLDPKGFRIGLHLDAGCGMPVEAETKAAIEAAAKKFADAGAILTPMAAFMTADMLHLQDVFWRARSWNDFAALSPEKQARVLPFIAKWCMGGADLSARDVIKGVNNYMVIRAASVKAIQPFDYVLSPTSPVPTYPAEWEMPSNSVERAMDHIGFTMPYNMSEQPASSINCAYTRRASRSACRSPAIVSTISVSCACRAGSSRRVGRRRRGRSPRSKHRRNETARHPDARYALSADQG